MPARNATGTDVQLSSVVAGELLVHEALELRVEIVVVGPGRRDACSTSE